MQKRTDGTTNTVPVPLHAEIRMKLMRPPRPVEIHDCLSSIY
jgi:hypothetical protein